MIDLAYTRIPVRLWVDDLDDVEPQALEQIRQTASLPWVEGMAVMPDVHFGKGATVGSVIVSRGAVSPAVVGVDIGCGMSAVRTPYTVDQLGDLKKLRHSLERSVPVGFNENKEPTHRTDHLFSELGPMSDLALPLEKKARHQLGTLGGGNHFIEVCSDEMERVWVMLHSGSRGTGNQLAQRHLETARGLMAEVATHYDGVAVPPDLAALLVGTPAYQAYMRDLHWCQKYAKANRQEMMLRSLKDLSYHVEGKLVAPSELTKDRVDCHHNYIEEDAAGGRLITRKGAVSAREGQLGIVPGSMGTRSFIVRGRGSADSYCSCSHGAGRRMSRNAARRAYTTADLVAQTEGVECRKDDGVLDEIPGAYKPIDDVMRQQADLVDVVATLRALICVKG